MPQKLSIAAMALPNCSLQNISAGAMAGSASPAAVITCQETPKRSAIHPKQGLQGYAPSGISVSPPCDNVANKRSASDDDSTRTKNEMLGLTTNRGPPFSAVKRCPRTSNSTLIKLPGGIPTGLSALRGNKVRAMMRPSPKVSR